MAFSDFPEQKQVVELLQRSLERGRLGHAYLFTGDDIVELEAVARTLAKTLNCHEPVRGTNNTAIDCCDQCNSCRKIDGGNHADVQWVRPESKLRQIRIASMRELMRTMNLKANEAEYKVGTLVGADRMNVESANAFLKTLEEPPTRSVLILLSTQPQRLLDTILSRCLRLTFAGGGGVRISEEDAAWLAGFSQQASQGKHGLLNRYQLLGHLLTRLAQKKEAVALALAERSPLQQHDDVDEKLRKKWEDELNASIEAEYRQQRAELLTTVQWWLRDVWLWLTSATEELLCFPDFAEAARKVAGNLKPEDALANLQVIEGTQRLLHTNVQEALALEVGLLKLKL